MARPTKYIGIRTIFPSSSQSRGDLVDPATPRCTEGRSPPRRRRGHAGCLEVIERPERRSHGRGRMIRGLGEMSDDLEPERRMGVHHVGECLALGRRAEDEQESRVPAARSQLHEQCPEHQTGRKRPDRQEREQDEQHESAGVRVLGGEEEAEDDRCEDHCRPDDVARLRSNRPSGPMAVEALGPQHERPQKGIAGHGDPRIVEGEAELPVGRCGAKPDRDHA